MRRLLLITLLASCSGEPSYEGLLCDESSGCPSGYRCVDGRCTNRPPAPLDAGTTPGEDAAISDAPVDDSGIGDAGIDDGGPEPQDSGTEDIGTPDASDPNLERCGDPIAYPTTGWEARHFTLTADNSFDSCFGVEDLASNDINRDYRSTGPFNGTIVDFGSRYTATRTFEEGIHTFLLSHDDGFRLRIDGDPVYELWQPGAYYGVRAYSAYLAAGAHQIEVEHFDNMGWAQVVVSWERGCTGIQTPASGWLITYHGYDQTSGSLIREQCYGFETLPTQFLSLAGLQLPNYGIVGRTMQNLRGMTTVDFNFADGLRAYANGVAFLDVWTPGPSISLNVTSYLPGPIELSFEKFATDASNVAISWQNVCEVIPNIGGEWWARYYRILYTPNPDTWTIDRNDCLGTQIISSDRLMQSGEPPQITSLGIVRLWGAEFIGTRTFGANTTVNTTYDDGIRIFDGGAQVYSDWSAPQVESTSLLFGAGTHAFRLEYLQNDGGTQIQFTW